MSAATLALLRGVVADLRFGVGGQAVGSQLQGWSFPEDGFTWSLGEYSRLRLPRCGRNEDLILILEGNPFLQPPQLQKQLLIVMFAGKELATYRLAGPFLRCIRLRPSKFSGSHNMLEFRYPTCSTPAAVGSTDTRVLSIAWRRIRVIRVPAARDDGGTLDPNTSVKRSTISGASARASKSVGLASGQDDTEKSASTTKSAFGCSAKELERFVIDALNTGETKSAGLVIADEVNMPGLTLELDTGLPDDLSVARCTMRQDGSWRFGFSAAWRDGTGEHSAATMVVWHWLATLPLCAAYSALGLTPGSFLLSLGDEAHSRGVAFCANNDDVLLIPDPYFMRSSGYAALKASFEQTLPFRERERVALWRGSTTGYRTIEGFMALPRVRLCLRAKRADAAGLLDAGFTGFAQLLAGEKNLLESLDLTRPFVEPEQFPNWMFHIDVDGNTNSWPGLFNKLLTGSVVLKITSENGWRQWYYDRLTPNRNFMPISMDLSDLIEKIKYLIYCVDEAESLGREGRALALSLSYKDELRRAADTLEEAILREHFRDAT